MEDLFLLCNTSTYYRNLVDNLISLKHKKNIHPNFNYKYPVMLFKELGQIYGGGVFGHGETDFDGLRAPKSSKIRVFRGPRIRFF